MTTYRLKSLDGDQVLAFNWNKKTGAIDGEGVAIILKLIADNRQIVTPPPDPKVYDIPETITDIATMSLLLGMHWKIPDNWPDFYGQRNSDVIY